MNKTALKNALIEVKEIETFAANSAKKLMEQEFLPKMEKSVRQALLEMENTEMGEASEISLDSGASVNVTVGSDGKVTIKAGDGTAPAVVETPGELPATPTDVAPVVPGIPAAPITEPTSTEVVGGEEGMTPEDEEELFEIVDDSEETPVVDDEAEGEEGATEEPAVEGGEEGATEEPIEEPVDGEETEEPAAEDGADDLGFGDEEMGGGADDERLGKIESDMEEMKGLLEKILEKVGEAEEAEGDVEIVDDEPGEEGLEGGEELGGEEGLEGGDEFGGGEVPGAEPGLGGEEEVPTEEPVAEDGEEEVVFEFDDVMDEDVVGSNQQGSVVGGRHYEEEVTEVDMKDLEEALQEMLGADSLEEYGEEHPMTVKDAMGGGEEAINEIEIESGEEEEIEEGEGISLTNRQGQNLKPNTPHKKVRSGLSESDKAQYESKLDGLKKENASLKVALKEYKESFVVLRKQINEVQTFNAKLAYANKVFTKGGLTNEEKNIIAEQFDNCNTADEAKSLYNKLIKENAIVSKPKSMKMPQAASTSSTKGALYENKETIRMKQLAGIN